MQHIQRIASPDVARVYPLPASTTMTWRRVATNKWEARLALPPIARQHIIVPSFAMADTTPAAYSFQFALHCPQASTLPAVPSEPRPGPGPTPNPGAPVSQHIDCWHTEQDLGQSTLTLTIRTTHAPRSFLLAVSVRPLELPVPQCPLQSLRVEVPQTFSQMDAEPALRSRICSPTALGMVLAGYARAPSWPDTVAACLDPATRAYGVWPLAIRWASLQGVIGAVEACHDWEPAIAALRSGRPVVCSIRFGRGELPSAPLAQSGGHLVLLYGIEADEVLVKDPAGSPLSEVTRRYPADEFARAWLGRRGGAYIFSSQAIEPAPTAG